MQVVAYTLCLLTLRKNCQERRKKLQVKLLQVVTIFVLVGIVFWKTTSVLVERWLKFDQSLSHGLIVIVLSAYLIAKHFEASTKPIRVQKTAIGLLATLSITWMVIAGANITILEQLLLIPLIFLIFWSLSDWDAARSILLPISFLIFAIPVWDYLTTPLVNLSATAVTWAITLTDIPAFINDNAISLPYGTLIIADGCSGLRYLSVALTLAAFLCLDSKINARKKWLIFSAAVCIGIVSNWIRIFIITVVGYQSDMQSSLMSDHEYFGWIIFAISMSPIIWIGSRFPTLKMENKKTSFGIHLPSILAMIFALFLGPLIFLTTQSQVESFKVSDWSDIGYLPYNREQNSSPDVQIDIAKKDRALQRILINWATEEKQNTVPYWPRSYNKDLWTLESSRKLSLGHDGGKLSLKIKHLSGKFNNRRLCQAIIHNIGGFWTDSYNAAKLLQIPSFIVGNPYYFAVVIEKMTTTKDCKSVEKEILNLLSETLDDSRQILEY